MTQKIVAILQQMEVCSINILKQHLLEEILNSIVLFQTIKNRQKPIAQLC